MRLARAKGASGRRPLATAIDGFFGTADRQRGRELRQNPDVAYIEADQQVSIDATQTPATWGLDRIDQRNLPLNTPTPTTPPAPGVTAYIIDTGIRATHSEFGGRVGPGYTAINDGRGTNDCNGHGTHVAGTVGGSTYGVAKQVSLGRSASSTAPGNGSTSGVIAGVDWVTGNHAAGARPWRT